MHRIYNPKLCLLRRRFFKTCGLHDSDDCDLASGGGYNWASGRGEGAHLPHNTPTICPHPHPHP